MRRRPTKDEAPQPSAVPGFTSKRVAPNAPDLQPPVPRGRELRPQDSGERQEAWLRSGGQTFFFVTDGFDPQPDGFQLVTHYYVPNGRVAWVKQLRVAPFMPPVFAFDQAKAVVLGGSQQFDWPTQNEPVGAPTEFPVRPSGHAGVWETPFGWEAYFDPLDPVPIIWKWHLRVVAGNALKNRAPFSFADPATWYLLPDIAVPASAYPAGLPGFPPENYEPQRMQVLQGDELTVHVFIPPDSTLCLFAEWHQVPEIPAFSTYAGALLQSQYGPATYPLLPSFGQLSGYQQVSDRKVAMKNAKRGWQG